jgi:ankyrin repeat protein
MRRKESLVKLLLDHGAEITATDNTGCTALHEAAMSGEDSVAKLLLDHSAEITATDDTGQTVLHEAAASGKDSVVKLLLDHGAEITATDSVGRTALHKAAWGGYSDVVGLLMDMKVNAGVSTNKNWTPLQLTAKLGHLAVPKQLLSKRAKGFSPVMKRPLDECLDPDFLDSFGFGALHRAVQKCHVDIVRLFIDGGANPHLLDLYGRSSLDWAVRHPDTFNAMGKFCESYMPTDVALQCTHLRSSVVKLLKLSRDVDHHSTASLFNHLGRCLLFLGDEEDGRIAFQQFTKPEIGTFRQETCCSMCYRGIDIIGKRYVCRSCPVDLCHSCKEKYDSGVSIPGCKQHNYLSIPEDTSNGSALETVNVPGLSIEEWLKQLESKYV